MERLLLHCSHDMIDFAADTEIWLTLASNSHHLSVRLSLPILWKLRKLQWF